MVTSHWLLLQVKPRQELRAIENLERQKGECYCPQIQVEKLIRGKRIQVEEPLFPGYVFIKVKVEGKALNYTNIRSSRGVSKIVGFGMDPIRIPESLILEIKRREQKNIVVNTENLPQAGDKVDILDGPLKGLQAIYSHAHGSQRSVVLIDLLSQKSPALLANTQIEKLVN